SLLPGEVAFLVLMLHPDDVGSFGRMVDGLPRCPGKDTGSDRPSRTRFLRCRVRRMCRSVTGGNDVHAAIAAFAFPAAKRTRAGRDCGRPPVGNLSCPGEETPAPVAHCVLGQGWRSAGRGVAPGFPRPISGNDRASWPGVLRTRITLPDLDI